MGVHAHVQRMDTLCLRGGSPRPRPENGRALSQGWDHARVQRTDVLRLAAHSRSEPAVSELVLRVTPSRWIQRGQHRPVTTRKLHRRKHSVPADTSETSSRGGTACP